MALRWRCALFSGSALAASGLELPPQQPVTIPLQEFVSVFEAQSSRPQQPKQRIHVSEYYGRVALGDPPQVFEVVFDTGSGNVVVPTVKCLDAPCRNHRRYHASRTAVQLGLDDGTPMRPGSSRETTTITYGTGRLTGEYVRDGICLEGLCTTLDFLGVTQESQFPFSELPFDGIMGLGLGGLSAGPTFNFVARLHSSDREPVFAFFLRELGASEASELTVGGYRPERLAGDLRWLPMPREEAQRSGYWLVTMRDMLVRGEPLGLCADTGATHRRCQVALDTGSSLLMGPPAQVQRLLQALGGGCGSELPTLQLLLDGEAGGTFELTLEAHDYADGCGLAVQAVELPASLGPLWVLGQAALRKYYSVYDAKRWRVGLGLARHGATPQPPAVSLASNVRAGEACEDDDRDMAANHLPGCRSFQAMGYCQRFEPLARRYCRLSCGLCTLRAGAAERPEEGVSVAGAGFLVAGERVVRKRQWVAEVPSESWAMLR